MTAYPVSDAAVMSKIFVPSMEKQGYPKPFAAAITATSAILGIIIPPSIPMVLYGVATNTSIKDFLENYGLASMCVKVRASEVPVLDLEKFGSEAQNKISDEISRSLTQDLLGAIVLGFTGILLIICA